MATMIKVGNRVVNLDNLTSAKLEVTVVPGRANQVLLDLGTIAERFDGDEADAVRWYLESQAADVEWLYRDHQTEDQIREHGAEWARSHPKEYGSFDAWDNGGQIAAIEKFGKLAEEKDFMWRLGFSQARAGQQTTTDEL